MAVVEKIKIEDSLSESYLDYALSVITGRALPDVRDGLKPVQRRVLYGMYELNANFNSPYKKSARIVGDVIGKYHAHGDTAVYDALVRLAQDFNMSLPLVDGQGNFGSIDGDNAAAMRYTESRLSKTSNIILEDLDKETVTFRPNYDSSLTEPSILPTPIPNLLVNGSSGIAVGYSVSIPTHNILDTLKTCLFFIRNQKMKDETLMENLIKNIQGPDFPTGGVIFGKKGIIDFYETGKGKIKLRAKTEVVNDKKKSYIIITELPYQVNKSKLIETIDELVRNKIIQGITHIQDESDRRGISIVITLKRDAYPEIVLNSLYKHTELEKSISMRFLAVEDETPKVFNLLNYIQTFTNFRRSVVIKRTLYYLENAKSKLHLLEGLQKALDNIDKVIKIIKSSKNHSEALDNLIDKFKFSELQAKSILEMRLSKLTNLEKDKLITEIKHLKELITKYSTILKSSKNIDKIIENEFIELIKTYKKFSRKTEIVDNYNELGYEDLIPNENMIITMSHRGYIKRVPAINYKIQNRGGKGVTGVKTYDDDFLKDIYHMMSHDRMLFITNLGKAFSLKVYEIPEASRTAKGNNIVNLIQLTKDEKIVSIIPVKKEYDPKSTLLTITKKGLVKQTLLNEFDNIRKNGLIALDINKGDEVLTGKISDSSVRSIMLLTRLGKTIRFAIDQVPTQSRNTKGVKAINLSNDDYIVDFVLVKNLNDRVMIITENGTGKSSYIKDYRSQNRSGKGLIGIKLNDKTGLAVASVIIEDNKDLMILESSGKIVRLDPKTIRVTSRTTSGVKLIKLNKDEYVIGVTKAEKDIEEN